MDSDRRSPGAQGAFVLALARGNNLVTLKTKHAAAWLKAYQAEEKFTGKLDLDYFGELYKKVKESYGSRRNFNRDIRGSRSSKP